MTFLLFQFCFHVEQRALVFWCLVSCGDRRSCANTCGRTKMQPGGEAASMLYVDLFFMSSSVEKKKNEYKLAPIRAQARNKRPR